MPEWFLQAVRSVLMWEDNGMDIDPIAEKLWAAIGNRINNEPTAGNPRY